MALPAFERQVLVQRAYLILEQSGSDMIIAALARAAMQMNGELPAALLHLVEEKLIADGRFTQSAVGLWGLEQWQQNAEELLVSQVFRSTGRRDHRRHCGTPPHHRTWRRTGLQR